MKGMKILAAVLAGLWLVLGVLTGCAPDRPSPERDGKTFILGDTSFNGENEEPDINPHNAYSGWACIRYGVGETLFRYTDDMEIEPWLAESCERPDERTWKITLRDEIRFSNGRIVDGEAVKECLEHLIRVHSRARRDLQIDGISAEGRTVTVTTAEPRPALLRYLSDPYSCIIDMKAGISGDGIVTGTGPYRAVSLRSGEELDLVKNENYREGSPGFDRVKVLTISEGDTLAMALRSGEIDGAYGIPYVSYPLFRNEDFVFSGCATGRAFLLQMNFQSPLTGESAVRRAVAMGIDKERFVRDVLGGNGYPAEGIWPAQFSFGGRTKGRAYDPEGARAVLEAAGWVDTDGDGIREKDGKKLEIRWLTYPSRQELPLLAEAAQADLRKIGMDVHITVTTDHNRLRKDPDSWDVYAGAMVTAPTGDPAYFFGSRCLERSSANDGHYRSSRLEALAEELDRTFEPARRAELAAEMEQILLEDDAFVFCSYIQMNLISRADIAGLTAHPCDFYEITAALRPAE